MQLIFHGGASEVGRSCIEIRSGLGRYLLDCGLKFHDGGMDYPAKVFETRTIDALFLSHAHLDHAGGLPFFEHFGLSCPIFCFQETKDLARILLRDSHRINRMKHTVEAFRNIDLSKALKDLRIVEPGVTKRFRNLKYTFLNSGHIPGSAVTKIEIDNTVILYTGDYNTHDTCLMRGADPDEWGHVDVLISEATYGNKTHPDRKKSERDILAKIEEVIERGGSVLLPVFAVGRAQEMLITLSKKEWKVPIYMDGMVKKITNAIARGSSPYIRNMENLRGMLDKVTIVRSPAQRKKINSQQAIIVTTSGMMQGGPAVGYLRKMYDDEKSAVLMTGFQARNTKGWWLLEEGTVKFDGEIRKVACEVQKYDFSAHLSMTDVEEVIKKVKPKILIFVHGPPEAIENLDAWAKEHARCEVFAPKVGDQIDILDSGEISHTQSYAADDSLFAPEEHQHGRGGVTEYDDFEWDD